MLSTFQASFQRMEQALQRLTDSIAAYNPSPTAADELVAEDDRLNADIQQLIQHQRNAQRIEQLRRLTQANDEKVKTHIRALASLRKEILAIPSTTDTTATSIRESSVADLLDYAEFISPTTLPPTFRRQPQQQPPSSPPEPSKRTIATPPEGAPQEDTYVHPTTLALNEQDKAWLDPLAQLPFEPWPSHDVMLRGSLADIQRMIESGRDPAGALTAEQKAEAEERAEQARREEEEADRRRREMFDGVGVGGGRRRTVVDDVFDPDA